MNADENATSSMPRAQNTEGLGNADAGAATAEDASGLPPNPFVGLRPFSSDEGLLFFGRDEQITELMQQLARGRFLAVVGSSGCGKSSLIRAGLIPKLKAGLLEATRDRWCFAAMKPGRAPLQNLAAALLSACDEGGDHSTDALSRELAEAIRLGGVQEITRYLSGHLNARDTSVLLLVDQFEELFRFGFHADEAAAGEAPGQWKRRRDEAADFVSIMLKLARQTSLPVYVVITMRSDFLSECDEFAELPQAMNSGLYLVPRLTRHQRMQAIQCPINLYGEEISEGLLDRVLNDLGAGPEQAPKGLDEESDELPVMQHALMRTWENWLGEQRSRWGGGLTGGPGEGGEQEAEPIDLRHYDAVGTIKSALSDDADRAFNSLDEDERRVAALMFQALADTDARGRRLRRPTRLSKLARITGADRDTIEKIIKVFRDDNRLFLTPTEDQLDGDPVVDISHESLIRRWVRLSQWVEDEVASRDQYLSLATAAVRLKEDRASLLRDPELQTAINWRNVRQPNVAWARRYHPEFGLAMNYLDASLKEREEEKVRKDNERLAELQRARQLARQRTRTAVIMTALVVALTLLLAVTMFALQRAQASEREAAAYAEGEKAANNQLQQQKDELKLSLQKEKELKDQLQVKSDQLEEQAEVVEQQKQVALAAKKQAEDARNQIAADYVTLKKQSDEIDRVSGEAVKSRDAGIASWKAATAVGESNVDVRKVSCDFESAIKGYKALGQDLPVAYLSESFGQLLLRFSNSNLEIPASGDLCEKAPADAQAKPSPPTPTPTPSKVVPVAAATETLPDSIDKVLGRAGDQPVLLRGLALNAWQKRAFELRGESVARYRRLNLHDNSARILIDLGEGLQSSNGAAWAPAQNSYTKPEEEAARTEVALTQAAILLFCDAYEDSDKTPVGLEQSASLLLRVGSRLNSRARMLPAHAAFVACPNVGTKPDDYFDLAARDYDKIIGAAPNPEVAQEKRKQLSDALFQTAQAYLSLKNWDEATKYFESAVKVYGDSPDPKQREAKATLLHDIGNFYYQLSVEAETAALGSDKVATAAAAKEAAKETEIGKTYFEREVDLFRNPTDSGSRDALASRLVQVGSVFTGTKEQNLANDYFERAVNVHLSVEPKDYAGAVKAVYAIIGTQPFGADNTAYYLRAFRYHLLAGNKDEAAAMFSSSIVSAINIQTLQGGYPPDKESLLEEVSTILHDGHFAPPPETRAEAYIALGSAYLSLKKPSLARRYFMEAQPLVQSSDNSKRGQLMFSLGQAWEMDGQRKLAKDAYNAAHDMYDKTKTDNPSDPFMSVNLQEVEAALGRLSAGDDTGAVPLDLETDLKGKPSHGGEPEGKAEFKATADGERAFTVHIKNVALPAGAILDVLIDGRKIGNFKLHGDKHRGKFILDTEQGHNVPQVSPGARVTVRSPSHEIIVEGTFPTNIYQIPGVR
jgi:tetratricopeptide (TPR) repeat protein/energy-coupling factor transporter ATP-binding protein EcfA2